jgi:hypothetical protein
MVSNFPIRRLSAVLISVRLCITFWSAGVENALRGLAGFPPWAVVSILALLSANLFPISFRFWRVLAHFGIAPS